MASKVLVIDAHMKRVGHSQFDRLSYILSSEWMRRLWTFQEAVLPGPDRLHICFQESIASLRSLLEDNDEHPMHDDIPSLQWALQEQLCRPKQRSIDLLWLMQGFVGRTTSFAEDEAVCLATLLEIPLTGFKALPSMKDIYLNMRNQLPVDLVFAPGPRLHDPGFQWAPSTFLGHGAEVFDGALLPLTLTPDGVLLEWPALLFDEDLILEYPIEIEKFPVVVDRTRKPTHALLWQPDSRDGRQGARRTITNPAILTNHALDSSILVSRVREERTNGQILHVAHWEVRVDVSELSPKTEDDALPPGRVKGRVIEDKLQWLLD
jgi:hypothetical protein